MAFRDEASGDHGEEGSRDPLVGTVINGKFHVERSIARGGMGRIYYGTQAPLDRPVALKIVKADSVNEDESQFFKRFLLEASILAKLQHPNVVTLFDYGRIEGAPVEMYFIAMEFLNGETLAERLRDLGALATFEALILFRQIARGLREAHSRGILHRDLKPSNIVIVPEADGEIVKLVDFGIGKLERSGEDLTRDGVLVGTPKYMAPEQFEGASSPASDVYSLGIIFYQLLTGALPFTGNTMAEVMIAKLSHPILPIRDVNPICDATENVERLVYKMLARLPEERATLEEVFFQLAACEAEVFGASGPSGPHLPMTGSGPSLFGSGSGSRPVMGFPASSRPHSIGALKVPYTIVAPGQVMSGATPKPGNPISGMTPRPMSTSSFPLVASSKPGLRLAVIVALVLSLASAAVTLFFVKTRPSGTNPDTLAVASASPAARPAAPTSFVLRIKSSPSGASVTEDGHDLGVTPVVVTIERASVASGPRLFEVKKEGHAPITLTQGPADADLEMVVSLAPETAHTVKSPPPHVGKPAGTSGKPPANTQPDDIRLRR
jgi:eukaryotic-like serine/threonine-protein kinase